jgi:hypothetical protein
MMEKALNPVCPEIGASVFIIKTIYDKVQGP